MTYYWTTKEGHKISVDDMTEEHLRNTLKMLMRMAHKRVAIREQLLRTFKEDEALQIELEQRDEL